MASASAWPASCHTWVQAVFVPKCLWFWTHSASPSVLRPLISMTMNMILDLLHWMMLLFPIVACLVAALMTLFKSRTGVEQKNCLPFGFDYVQGVLRFFEIQIGEEVPLQCLREDSPHPWFGQVIMNLGLWMIMILMLNMLIAMMAKTFDRIYEAAMVDFQYNLIGDLLQMISEPAPPPVLRTERAMDDTDDREILGVLLWIGTAGGGLVEGGYHREKRGPSWSPSRWSWWYTES